MLDVLKTIFDASGHQHLVHLVKLRKCWNREIGGFIARHAMPSKISVEENFNLDRQYITELRRENQKKDLLEALEEMIGRNFRDWKGFRSVLLNTNSVPWDVLGVGALTATIVAVSGLFYFRRMERVFADVA